jgi:uncharacterized MAPEG superfamily protein
MHLIAWLLLIAALLPYVAAGIAKGGDKSFDNNEPRAWLARQSGWRGRANAAQKNMLEGLPFFFAVVLLALYLDAELVPLRNLMMAWIVLRLAYIAVYVWGKGSLRSLLWILSLAVDIAILFKWA